ncbi:MAG: DUF262 domain-containing protein [Phycisphaeraceae bacterium]|nr:DUF262 domain-containing protein [Phycisphaeraceae bacterium]
MSTAEQIQRKNIDGKGKTVREILFSRKFFIDYYQREYKWQAKQLDELISDLTGVFLRGYEPEHERRAVAGYDHYFLGSIIVSQKDGRDFIIDGQQRLTTLTLLLLFLMKRQQAAGQQQTLQEMIFSEEYGEKSFNIDVPERRDVMQALFNGETPDEEGLAESSRNIIARYSEIEDMFPAEIDENALPYFVDWLTKNVHLVEITAYSDDVAYTIFETMNDRGLSLSPTDMLKGYLLANITDEQSRTHASAEWKRLIATLRALTPDSHESDADFFKAWLRAQHADSIRERRKNARPLAWDLIGSEYHRWVRDQAERLGLVHNGHPRSGAYRDFITAEMAFYAKWYLVIRQAEMTPSKGFETLFCNATNQFTHQPTLLLAAIQASDSDNTIRLKMRLVAKYADIFLARRHCNFRNTDYNTLQYNIFTVVRDIRRKDPPEIAALLRTRLEEQEESLVGFETLYLNQWSHKPIKRLLARMADYIEVGSGGEARYAEYVTLRGKKAYEVEHIWANHPEDFRDEFQHKADFEDYRNRLGGLLLLPKQFNASYGDKPYTDKLEYYFGQNALARTLHPRAYEHSPGFLRFKNEQGLPFEPHPQFKRADLNARQNLYRAIAERIWDPVWLDRILEGEEAIP